ncbi:uncharacterized protein LOC122505625 [Leptopilina heterotoma]|uniref:uncharacterized protein LOC122505625 n=1 Tax=Leptopilina heterotoma TaxID=63436 RepID=UPI001CA8810C|nr:uncharacterized protein LOC122505625 [Leptopilina heterotoma]XP_043473303.1 uncharacterized protein LOC122505625 [Leptopilina heterotoma]
MSQYDDYKLSLSYETNNNILTGEEFSFATTSISSHSVLSKLTDDVSMCSSTNNRLFAGTTPKQCMAKNSLELLKNNPIHDSQSKESESSEAFSILKSLIDENIISLQRERELYSSQTTTIANYQNDNDNISVKSDLTLLAQFTSTDNQSESSYQTIDSYHDSDVDMFDDLNSPEMNIINDNDNNRNNSEPLNLSYPKFLANYSNEFCEDKSYFKPEIKYHSQFVSSLRNEVYDVSMNVIQRCVEEVIASLEMTENDL